jgi:hypothetical protein
MKSLYESATVEEVKQRLATLTPTTPRLWGKMDAPQMVAHCSAAMEMATGDLVIPMVWIGRLIGPLFKSQYSNEKPWGKGTPTAPALIVNGEQDLPAQRENLIALIERFHHGGPTHCTKFPHPFFGKLTPEEWAKGMYKHLDHHLRQFNA